MNNYIWASKPLNLITIAYIYFFGEKMKHHLNYSKEDPNYVLLDEIFKIIGSRKSKMIITSKGIKNVNMMVLSIKIILQRCSLI